MTAAFHQITGVGFCLKVLSFQNDFDFAFCLKNLIAAVYVQVPSYGLERVDDYIEVSLNQGPLPYFFTVAAGLTYIVCSVEGLLTQGSIVLR